MTELSVIIPSRNGVYLQKTIDDVLAKSKSDIEIIIILDGWWPKETGWTDPRIVVVHHGGPGDFRGMRAAINSGVRVSTGKYLLKCDDHCLFDDGFDLKLMADVRKDWVVIPRRHRLDAEKWEIIQDGRPPIDYMKIQVDDGYIHGVEWKRDRSDPIYDIDNTPSFQGSCWFMSRYCWDTFVGPLDEINYGWFTQEPQEIGMKVWLGGGRVVVNKKTFYAHWHKQSTNYQFTNAEQRSFNNSVAKGRTYSFEHWTQHPDFAKFMEKWK